jgi:hypothetical protein
VVPHHKDVGQFTGFGSVGAPTSSPSCGECNREVRSQAPHKSRAVFTISILACFIRRQNAAIILTERENCTLCEAFEVSPTRDAVEETPEPLICSYPGSAVETPDEVFDAGDFQFELADFLSRPNAVDSGLQVPLPPLAHPQYINALFNSILQSVGRAADVPRVTKHTALLTGACKLYGVGSFTNGRRTST